MTGVLLSSQTIPSALPSALAVFPLTGAMLLPRARLPLNIFEPRYLALIEDVLGRGRMIGMIQPSGADSGVAAPLYSVGCAGRITSFNETDDGHFLIVLTGICRFRIKAELPPTRLYRMVNPDWKPYLEDLDASAPLDIDRERLVGVLRLYFKKHGISVDWNVVKNAPNEVLVPTVIMICPLAANEKQALLEAKCPSLRAAMLLTLLEMAVMPQAENEGDIRH